MNINAKSSNLAKIIYELRSFEFFYITIDLLVILKKKTMAFISSLWTYYVSIDGTWHSR